MLLITLLDCPTGITVPLDRLKKGIKEVKVLSLSVIHLGLESRVPDCFFSPCGHMWSLGLWEEE